MVTAWERGAPFVIGERQSREEGRWHRLLSGIYWQLIRRFAFPDFPRLGYDFCLLDRDVVDAINRINEKNSSIFVLIYWLGYRPVRLPITRQIRQAGHSQWKLARKISFTIDTLIGFTYLPARAIVGLSLAASFASLAYFVFLVAVWLRSNTAPAGWMTLAGVAFLGGSLILFALGIIAEYLVRVLDESRKRPPFVVERVEAPSERSQV
jgi:polyisoprenyl-phosphate glycosyltransferase